MSLDYNGSKGTRLDVERAITITGIQPFIYESSAANSVFHSGSIRLRKRMAHGVAVSATYAYSKSIDDASSIGGGGRSNRRKPLLRSPQRVPSTFDHGPTISPYSSYSMPFSENYRFVS